MMPKPIKIIIHVILLSVLITQITATITPLPLPAKLHKCFDKLCNDKYYRNDPAEKIGYTCLGGYLWTNVDVKCSKTPKKTLEYLGNLLKPLYDQTHGRRRKRQMGRYRREYRTLSDGERMAFHNACNRLKQDTSLSPNVYDAIALFHDQAVERTAHFGAAFLPWHRLYLYAFENALQSVDPSVTVPYWDSTLDSKIDNPSRSIMWSPDFAGNGNGFVRTGPFAWMTPFGQLRRNHGGGMLMTDFDIADIMRLPSSSAFSGRLEAAHNQVHAWVGGLMNDFGSASVDPVFFMHHAFVDKIWWDYQRMGQAGFIYPQGASGSHAPDAPMLNIVIGGRSGFRNVEGYSQQWHNMAGYAPSPSCQNRCGGSPYLRCTNAGCATVTVTDMQQQQQAPQQQPQPQQQAFFPQPSTVGPQNFWFDRAWNWRFRRAVKYPGDPGHRGHYRPSSSKGSDPAPCNDHSCLGFSVQNDFRINCHVDHKMWAYLAVRVVHIRQEGKVYNSYPVSGFKIDYTCDVFNYTSVLKNYINPEHPASYRYCKEDESGVFRVTVKSSGMNYLGSYAEYAYLDNRLPIDSKVLYLGFKRPGKHSSKVFLSSFDHCGRVCRPKCRVPGSKPARYHSCSGYFNIDSHPPHNYGHDISDAILKYWNFKSGSGCPTTMEDSVDIVFFCDYKTQWWKTTSSAYPQSSAKRDY